MAINDILNSLSNAMEETRQELAGVLKQISEVQQERSRIAAMPPHTDDITRAFTRGLDAACASFQTRLGWNLNDRNICEPGAAATLRGSSPQLLSISQRAPEDGRAHDSPLPPSIMGEHQSTIDAAALVFFLRPAIKEQIPALVERHCPSAKDGLREADRDRLLGELDARIADLTAKREELQRSMMAARRAVGSGS